MNLFAALMYLLSCGPPEEDSDCLMRCHDCELSCVRDRSWWAPGQDQVCGDECNVDNDMWFCAVEVGECAVMVF